MTELPPVENQPIHIVEGSRFPKPSSQEIKVLLQRLKPVLTDYRSNLLGGDAQNSQLASLDRLTLLVDHLTQEGSNLCYSLSSDRVENGAQTLVIGIDPKTKQGLSPALANSTVRLKYRNINPENPIHARAKSPFESVLELSLSARRGGDPYPTVWLGLHKDGSVTSHGNIQRTYQASFNNNFSSADYYQLAGYLFEEADEYTASPSVPFNSRILRLHEEGRRASVELLLDIGRKVKGYWDGRLSESFKQAMSASDRESTRTLTDFITLLREMRQNNIYTRRHDKYEPYEHTLYFEKPGNSYGISLLLRREGDRTTMSIKRYTIVDHVRRQLTFDPVSIRITTKSNLSEGQVQLSYDQERPQVVANTGDISLGVQGLRDLMRQCRVPEPLAA